MKKNQEVPESTPNFPYTTKPSTLRKFLALVPQKPKPVKINATLVQSWGFRDTNDKSIIRVLKAAGLIGSNGEPTSDYVAFMHKGTGPAHLAQKIRALYPQLFETSHSPHKEPNEAIENLFNIHSGGATIPHQIQTFKALCDHADFSANKPATAPTPATGALGKTNPPETGHNNSDGPKIHIDLHIHLPGNKNRRDYEYMFEDIARYIYGREIRSSEQNEQPE
jgi:hypothetical protein